MDDKEYIKNNCSVCKNKNTSLCEIHRTIDGNYRCIYCERGDFIDE